MTAFLASARDLTCRIISVWIIVSVAVNPGYNYKRIKGVTGTAIKGNFIEFFRLTQDDGKKTGGKSVRNKDGKRGRV